MKNTFDYNIVETGSICENCVIIKCRATGKAVIFDPGDDAHKIENQLKKMNAEPLLILNTHAHYDHIGAVNSLKEKFKIKFLIHQKEKEYCQDPAKNFSAYSGKKMVIEPDDFVKEGEIIKVGKVEIKVLETPGHTKGGVCYLTEDLLIAGDTIFQGSIGRCDLYGGNQQQLLDNIHDKISILPDQTRIISGHGGMSTVGDEKRNNPFLR